MKKSNVTVYAIINQFHIVHDCFKTRKQAIKGLRNYKNTDNFYYFTEQIKVNTTDPTLF